MLARGPKGETEDCTFPRVAEYRVGFVSPTHTDDQCQRDGPAPSILNATNGSGRGEAALPSSPPSPPIQERHRERGQEKALVLGLFVSMASSILIKGGAKVIRHYEA